MAGAEPDGPVELPVPPVDEAGMFEWLWPRRVVPDVVDGIEGWVAGAAVLVGSVGEPGVAGEPDGLAGDGVDGMPGAVAAPGPAPAGLGGAPPGDVWAKAAPVDKRATAPAARSMFLMGGSSLWRAVKSRTRLMD